MKLGANDVSAVKIGATDVNKVYLGSNLVWEKAVGTLLLDLYPNAVVAYSLRQLSTSYNGSAIKVRRSSDSNEQDINFVANELDTTSLLSFVGSGSGFIPTWYDQSGNTNNQFQSSASPQPNTVDSGTLVTLNGNPTARFGFNRFMQTSSAVSLGSPSEMWIFTVLNLDDVNTYHWVYGCSAASNNNGGFNFYVGGGDLFVGIQGATYVQLKTPITTGNKLLSIRMRGGQTTANAVEVYIDSELATLTATHSGTSNATFSDFIHKLGARENDLFRYIGDISEFVIKTGDQSANRAGIESNINSNYNMYWDGSQNGLLDDYPNASAAYSLRALSSAYTGAAIKVRRSSDNAEQDVNLLYDGSLNTASLLSFVGAGDGFVTTWYDQSGNGNDASETTASGQASIVLSGVLNTTNGNVAAFGKSNTAYATGYSVFTAADGTYSGFVVSKLVDSFDGVMALNNLSSGGGGEIFRYFNTSSTTFRIQSWDSSGVAPVLVTEPISANSNAISSFIRGLDSVTTSSNSLTNSLLGLGAPRKNVEERLLIMGYNGATNGLESYFSEAILYPSDQTSNRVGIESNINSNYNVFWDGSQTGILDDYPNAEAAYSLRALNSAYTSSAIRVRRSSDNAERDIGLLYDGSLDTSSLLSFVGAGDGFVTIWYDQSGEGNDAAQGSASKQPKIVSSGVVITENGEPSVEFNGTTDYIQNELSVGATVTAFAVSKIVSEPDYNFIYDSFGTNSRLRLGLWFTQEYFADNGDGLIVEATTASDGNQHLFFAKHSNSEVSISVDQDTLQTTSTTNFSQNSEHWNIGARNDGADHFLDGTIQELIIYPSDETSNRVGIETNINNHYTIY